MGNNNSGHAINQPPRPWTQSLPRDVHRQKKYGAMQGTKVLPERIPGQRLRPTENGRSLQFQGTISQNKRIEEPSARFPHGYQHSTSMTALNHPPVRASVSYNQQSNSINDLRFGMSPTKSFLSEPDLREPSPPMHIVNGNAGGAHTSHSIISDSPTKGKIKSKKRYKAPPPPAFHFVDDGLERPSSLPSPFKENWPTGSVLDQPKPRKPGLFKKKHESRMTRYDQSTPSPDIKEEREVRSLDRLSSSRRHSNAPLNFKRTSKRDLKEKTRSLDNLQHEIRRSLPSMNSSLHNLEIIGSIPSEEGKSWHDVNPELHKRYDRNVDRKFEPMELDSNQVENSRRHNSLERQSKPHKKSSIVETKLDDKRPLESRMSCPIEERRIVPSLEHKHPPNYRRSTSTTSHNQAEALEAVKDEWEKAEEEWYNKRKKSENLQKEILNVAKNLKKISHSFDQEKNDEKNTSFEVDIRTPPLETAPEPQPKTFFFGMEPESKINTQEEQTSALVKINEQDSVIIRNQTVEYSKHSLKTKSKKELKEKENWNRSLDYREMKLKTKDAENNCEIYEDKRALSRKIDEFVATIERSKAKLKSSKEEFYNSLSNGDGGYHSRQNSGSFQKSDDEECIKMKLQPMLPRRQLELPRFSPNAAWHSFNVDTPLRNKENDVDIVCADEYYTSEDQIHRNTRPTAPLKGTGEKSADSGISGDGGSPGLQDFEPLTPEKIKLLPAPLAVSSPVASSQHEGRAWTPAQDLDDNSLEESSGDRNSKGSYPTEVSTMPKLTSRSNMFSKQAEGDTVDGIEHFEQYSRDLSQNNKISVAVGTDPIFDNSINDPEFNSLKRHHPPQSTPKNYEDPIVEAANPEICNVNAWRENWSLSRSIPNSLNNCDEVEQLNNSNISGRSRSESRMSGCNKMNSPDNRNCGPVTPSYMLHGNAGHIMYLPEYKSYSLEDRKTRKHQDKSKKCPSTPEQERKPPSGDENPGEPERDQWQAPVNAQQAATSTFPYLENIGNIGWRKQKKFSYQSTVKMLEKKKLEEKLSKEAEANEERRLRELEAMMKVEEEFQRKREREKKRLKKQLKLYKKQSPPSDVPDFEKSTLEDKFYSPYPSQNNLEHRLEISNQNNPVPSPSSPVPSFQSRRAVTTYQSLPLEYPNASLYERRENAPQNLNLFYGIKNWVKGKKDPKILSNGGYQSDTSTATGASGSRQEPDGAPASSPNRKVNGDFRAEVIAGSRFRNGISGRKTPSEAGNSRSPSEASRNSHSKRPFTPDSKRTVSPVSSKRSFASEKCFLTQELSEMKQEHRQYRQYKPPTRKQIYSSSQMPLKITPRVVESPAAYDYRRAFYHSNNPPSPSTKCHFQDESDRYSRHSNDSRVSRRSGASSSKRSTPIDRQPPPPRVISPRPPSRRPSSADRPNRPPAAMPPFPVYPNEPTIIPIRGPNAYPKTYSCTARVDNNPARFAQSLITPYQPNRVYRPVVYSTPPHVSVLQVT